MNLKTTRNLTSVIHRPHINGMMLIVAMIVATSSGCATMSGYSAPVSNPVFVRANNHEVAWERTVDVVHEYLFEIERENKLGGVLETRYKTGSNVLEPWHRDSVGYANRMESTLQSIRRKAYVSITPVQGGYLVGVEAHKELEDVAQAANLQGAALLEARDLVPEEQSHARHPEREAQQLARRHALAQEQHREGDRPGRHRVGDDRRAARGYGQQAQDHQRAAHFFVCGVCRGPRGRSGGRCAPCGQRTMVMVGLL